MPVLLFDIDGTLIRTGGAGKAAMEAALKSAFGVADLYDKVPYSGRTDPAITRDLLAVHGVEVTPANLRTLQQTYLEHLPAALAEFGGTVCPGVDQILPRLQATPGVTLGLLTGNLKAGAERKLGHFDLWKFFPTGGFGDVHTDRDDVARDALAAAEAYLGASVNPAAVWVIGDTPLDVKCARAIGARAVAVATGWHELEELEATGADYVTTNFADPAELLRRLLSEED